MEQLNKPLFAIYKNGLYKGNTRGYSANDAIRNYIIESDLEFCLNDEEFVLQYSAMATIEQIHYTKRQDSTRMVNVSVERNC